MQTDNQYAKNIFIGYMGSGKTTIGKRLAENLGLNFIDMDLFIENRYRKTVSQIFSEKGEDAFREIEHRALQEIAGFEDVVVSTGGGVPCFYDNMSLMNECGASIYLRVSVREPFQPSVAGSRPYLTFTTLPSQESVLKLIKENFSASKRSISNVTVAEKTKELVQKSETPEAKIKAIQQFLANSMDNSYLALTETGGRIRPDWLIRQLSGLLLPEG